MSTLNGAPVLDLTLTETLTGAWSGEVQADSATALTSPLTLLVDGETFVCTAQQADVEAGRYKAKIIGGGGGLGTVLDARYYVSPTIGTVLADICSEAGEALDPTTATTILTRSVPRWSRLKGEAQAAIRQVADFLGVQWRITRTGLLWLGTDIWEPLATAPKLIETDFDPQARLRVVSYDGSSERPVIKPGVTVDGVRIVSTVLRLDGGKLRHELYSDETKGSGGLVAQVVRRVLELLQPKIDLSRFYPGRVVGQAPDGTLTILMDDRLVAGKWKGLDRVPAVFGLPGVSVQMVPGARVRLFWDGGDPSRARAGHFDAGAGPAQEITLTLAAGGKLVIDGDLEVTGEVTANADNPATKVTLTGHRHLETGGTTNAPTVPEV